MPGTFRIGNIAGIDIDHVFCAMLASVCRAAVPPVLRFTDVCPHALATTAMLRATAQR